MAIRRRVLDRRVGVATESARIELGVAMNALKAGVCALALMVGSCATAQRYSDSGEKPDTIVYAVTNTAECPARLHAAVAEEADEVVVVEPRRICLTHTQILVQCRSMRMMIAMDNLRRIDMRSMPQGDAYGTGSYANGMGAITDRMDRETKRFCTAVRQEYERIQHTTAVQQPAVAQPNNP